MMTRFDKKLLYGILSVITFLLIPFGDIYSSMYGNGVFYKHYMLPYGLSITKINDTFVGSNQYWHYECYICPGDTFKIANGEAYFINKISAYKVQSDSVFVLVSSANEKMIKLVFTSEETVNKNSPMAHQVESAIPNEYTNIQHPTHFSYYWRLYLIILIFVFFTYLILFTRLIIRDKSDQR